MKFRTCVLAFLGILSLASSSSAGEVIDFENAPTGSLDPFFYAEQGLVISGANIFRVPFGSWASARSGVQGMFPVNNNSVDGTSWQTVLASHGIPISNASGRISDVRFFVPQTDQPAPINSFSIGYGYDSDGGESHQAVVIQAFDAFDNMVLNVARPSLYYDGYETFSVPGAVRLRLTQNGFVGFDDLSFTAIPEPSSVCMMVMCTALVFARRQNRNHK